MVVAAASSYAIGAAAFAALAAWLVLRARARVEVRPDALRIAAAAALTAWWSGVLAWQMWFGGVAPLLLETAELLRCGAWSALLLALAGGRQPGAARAWYRGRRGALALVYAGAAALALAPLVLHAYLAFFPALLLRVALTLIGMLLVEQLYRGRPPQQRWGIKFACIGIGGMFVYDFYMYSDAMLLHAFNPELWSARGAVNALTAPLLAVAAARSTARPADAPQLALSRPALMHSATLIGAACYLLAMGVAGYYLRYAGGSWGATMQLAFLFGAALLLAGILFSGSYRAGLKVFINKHFYRYHYDYREEWLRLTRTLSEQGPALGARCIQALADLVDSPAGALWICRESGLCEAAAHWNMPLPGATEAAQSPFCRFMEEKQWLVDVARHEGAALPDWLAAMPKAWLVLPLLLDGRLFGFVLLQRSRSGVKLNWEVIDLLKIAGSQIASCLAQRETAAALALARQFDSFNRMSTFVVHDLKNLVSQLSLLLANAEKHKDNPVFQQDMLETVDFAVQKMRRMLQKLSRIGSPERLLPLPLGQLLRQAVALKSALQPVPVLDVGEEELQVLADAERLERVLGHLIQNAIEATPRGGAVRVRLLREGASAVIEVSDTGGGMSADFIRERLFKPFDSTKPAGMGIGAFESREYAVELKGRLAVDSTPGQGSVFRLSLPLHDGGVEDRAAAAVPEPMALM